VAADRLRDPVFLGAVAAPVMAAFAAVWFIVPTLLPGVSSGDAAEFQTVGPVMGTAHPTGYPSYIVLGWLASVVLAPFGDPAFRMNLLEAILAGVAAATTSAVVLILTGRRLIALASGLAMVTMPFATSVAATAPLRGWQTTPFFMRLATHADPHMFHVALVGILFVLLLTWDNRRHHEDAGVVARADRWLVASAVTYGVAITDHSLALLLPPAIGLFVLMADWRVVLRWRTVAACVVALVGTATLFWLELPIRAAMGAPLVYGHPDTWKGFQFVVLAKQFGGDLYDPLGNLDLKAGAVYGLMTGWLGPLIWAAWLGLATSIVRRPRYVVLSGLALVATCIFSTSYANSDIERYFLVPLLVVFTWIGLGAADLVEGAAWLAGRLHGTARPADAEPADAESAGAAEAGGDTPTTVHPPVSLDWAARTLLLAEVAVAVFMAASAVAVIPERQQFHSDLHPGGVSEARPTGDAAWAHAVLADPAQGGLPANAVIETYWYKSTSLWYAQKVEGLRPDVLIVDDSMRKNDHIGPAGEVWDVFDRYLGQRPVFTVRPWDGCDGIRDLGNAFQLETTSLSGVYHVVARFEPYVSMPRCDPVNPNIQ
jgi:hypothetical protein